MRHLINYKLFEADEISVIEDTLRDILLDIKDDGIDSKTHTSWEIPKEDVFIPGMREHIITIMIWRGDEYNSNGESNTFKYEDARDTIKRIESYLNGNGYKFKVARILANRLSSEEHLYRMCKGADIKWTISIDFTKLSTNWKK